MKGPSVIICSRNRASQLAECLAKIPNDSFETHDVEMILVDSASSDETAKMMADHAAKAIYPVKCFTAPKAGLGLARNLGIEAATRELLVIAIFQMTILCSCCTTSIKSVISSVADAFYCGTKRMRW